MRDCELACKLMDKKGEKKNTWNMHRVQDAPLEFVARGSFLFVYKKKKMDESGRNIVIVNR